MTRGLPDTRKLVLDFALMGNGGHSRVRLLRFGPFELDTKLGQLRKHDIPIRLQEQPLKLLLCLLESPGAVMSREELRRRIWGEGTFVDFDHGLNSSITRLRRALSDSADDPRYIETFARKGYRFIAPVSEYVSAEFHAEPDLTLDTQPALVKPTDPAIRRRLVLLVGIAGSLIAIAILYLRSISDRSPAHTIAPLTNYLGSEVSPSFAPDGERVAFSWDGEKRDNFDIYLKQIGVAAPVRLTFDPRPEMSPAWSPDGRTIAFLRFLDTGKAEVILTPSLGSGPERRLTETMAPGDSELWRYRLLSWSPDSKWLVAPDSPSLDSSLGLFLISAETGEKRRLTHTIRYDDLEPAFSPDMKRLAFSRYAGSATSYLWILELSNSLHPLGQPRQLVFEPRQNSSPVWVPNGKSLLFAHQSLAGESELWYTTLTGNVTKNSDPLLYRSGIIFTLSSKQNRLVYSQALGDSNIWAFQSSGAPLYRVPRFSSTAWITSSFEELTPAFSPDGRSIAVQSTRSGWSEIWIHDRNGTATRQLTNLRGSIAGFPHWSPDGRKIVFHWRPANRSGTASIWVVDVSSGQSRRITVGQPDEETKPSWSRDGKWIYFSSRRSGSRDLWRIPAEGGAATQITHHGGFLAYESADGKQLFFAKFRGTGSIWRIPVAGGNEQQLITDVAGDGTAYALGRRGIYFVRESRPGVNQKLGFYDFESGSITLLADLARPVMIGIAVSPDESLLLYSHNGKKDYLGNDLMLIENFRPPR